MQGRWNCFRAELPKQIFRRGVLLVSVLLLLCSAAVPILVDRFSLYYSRAEESNRTDELYARYQEEFAALDLESMTPGQQLVANLMDQLTKEAVEAAKKYQLDIYEDIVIDGEHFNLCSYYNDKLTDSILKLELKDTQMSQDGINFFLNYLVSQQILYYIPLSSDAEIQFFEKEYRELTEIFESLSAPVDRKQLAERELARLRAEFEQKRQEDGFGEDGEEYYTKEIERFEQICRLGAYDPDHWAHTMLYFGGLESDEEYLSQLENQVVLDTNRPLSGSYLDQDTGKYYQSVDTLPLDEYKPIYNRYVENYRREYQERVYGVKHNVRPCQNSYSSNMRDVRALAASVLPLLLFVPILAGVLCARAVGGEYTGNTLSNLLSRPVTRDGVLLSKLFCCTAFSAVLTAACGLVSAVVSGILCGAQGLFSPIMFRLFGSLHHVPFPLWFAARCGEVVCLSALVCGLCALLSLLSRRRWTGMAAAPLLPLLIGLRAFLPGFTRAREEFADSQLIYQTAPQEFYPDTLHFDWCGVYESMAERFVISWFLLILVAAAFAACLWLFRRQEISVQTPKKLFETG